MIKINGINLDEKTANLYVKNLDKNCAIVDAHGFNSFINHKIDGKSIMDNLKIIQSLLEIEKLKNIKFDKSYSEQINIVKEFYKTYFPSISETIDSIIDNKNPDYNVVLQLGKSVHSSVGHSGFATKLNFVVGLDGSLEGMITLVHELSHAISAHHTETISQTKAINSKDLSNQEKNELIAKFNEFCKHKSDFDIDCIGEIESHIVENLFVQYLLDKKIISQENYDTYFLSRKISLNNNLNLIFEENEIISNLPCPITYESVLKFIQNKHNEHSSNFKNIINRLKIMSERDEKSGKHSKYMYRYVVGEIVSSVWFDKYLTNLKNKKEMLDKFISYLSNTDKLNINSASEFLINEDFMNCINDYINLNEHNNEISI